LADGIINETLLAANCTDGQVTSHTFVELRLVSSEHNILAWAAEIPLPSVASSSSWTHSSSVRAASWPVAEAGGREKMLKAPRENIDGQWN
jgi:hypothetical protein